MHDFLHPDRIVVGSDHQSASIRVSELFEAIKAPFVVTDPPTAETIKYASNAFLATKVSFINVVANLCEAVGPTCARSCSAWATTNASDSSSWYRGRVGGEVASPRTPAPWSASPRTPATTSSCSRAGGAGSGRAGGRLGPKGASGPSGDRRGEATSALEALAKSAKIAELPARC